MWPLLLLLGNRPLLGTIAGVPLTVRLSPTPLVTTFTILTLFLLRLFIILAHVLVITWLLPTTCPLSPLTGQPSYRSCKALLTTLLRVTPLLCM
jgi:hypothetical protein